MKKELAMLRLLCGVIDGIIVMVPIQFIMMGIFSVSTSQAEFFYKFLFAVYGVLCIEYTGGRTIGKTIGKIKVIDTDTDFGKPNMLYIGIRELTKSLYLIPVIGWALCAVSIVMMFVNGKAIHDYTGGTRVITLRHEAALREEAGIK